ncbi:MAG: DUF4349 domain-containing protein [Streptosporangiaceae bacterium]
MTSRVRPRRIAIGGAVLLSGCVLLAACSGGSTANTASSGSGSGQVTRLGPEAAPAKVPGAHAAGALGSATYGGTSNRGNAIETARLTPANQSIIYTASLTVRSDDVAAAAKRAITAVVAAGGYTADEHVSGKSAGKSRHETISLTLKVPVPSYQAVLAQLSAPTFGRQLALQQHATDVTQQVADVNSLVASEQDAIAALRGLLKRAASVSGLLQVQQQISQDQSYLNALQSQQRALNAETSYATVTMTLVSPPKAAHHKASKRGFLAGLAAGWRALRHAGGWLLTALGAALPFLILALLLGAIGYLGWRRLGGRRATPPQPTDSAG